MSEKRYRGSRNHKEKSAEAQVRVETDDSFSYLYILKVLAGIVLINCALSFYITRSATWGVQTRWTDPRYVEFQAKKLLGTPLLNISDVELSKYNGLNPDLPVYVAIDGRVYDVSVNRLTYGPGGPYAFFAGRDAARAFHTGCFETHLTHDLRGLDQKAARADIVGWQKFFEHSPKYWYVGQVWHEPLRGDPPPPCENGHNQPSHNQQQSVRDAKVVRGTHTADPHQPGHAHRPGKVRGHHQKQEI